MNSGITFWERFLFQRIGTDSVNHTVPGEIKTFSNSQEMWSTHAITTPVKSKLRFCNGNHARQKVWNFLGTFSSIWKVCRGYWPTQTPTQKLELNFRCLFPRKLFQPWYHLKWFFKLYNLSYSDLSFNLWVYNPKKSRNSTYI